MNIPSISTGAMASHQVIAALLFVENELRFKSFRVVYEVGPLGLSAGGNVVQLIRASPFLSTHSQVLQFSR